MIWRLKRSFQSFHPHAFYAGDGLRQRHKLAQINSFTEREIVRMEKPAPPIGQDSIAEQIRELSLNMSTQIVRQDANFQRQFDGHQLSPLRPQVVTNAAIALEFVFDFR